MRPIDADALEPKFVHGRWDDTYVSETELMNAPTLDVVERKKGRWIRISDEPFADRFKCSECGEPPPIEDFEWCLSNYCPNCGAEMKEENK